MKIPAIPVLLVASGLLFGCSDSADPCKANAGQKSTDASQESTDSDYQFSADKKDATRYTEKANKSVYDQLAFDDKTAYEDVDRGFIAPLLNDGVIKDTFDAPALNFMQDKDAPATVNPSLWRHAQLVDRGGLYKVTDHIYQVRGQDLVMCQLQGFAAEQHAMSQVLDSRRISFVLLLWFAVRQRWCAATSFL